MEKREHDRLRLISVITFVMAVVAAIFAGVLFVLHLHAESQPLPAPEKYACNFVDYTISNMKFDAFSGIFAMLGIANLSFPFIVNVKNTRLYGISLSRVMYSEFPWHGWAYVIYSLFVIGGVYFSKMGDLAGAMVCLAGNVFACISIAVLSAVFVYRQHKYAGNMIENYLTVPPRKESESGKVERLLRSGKYIRAYFEATQSVPERVVQNLLDEFERENLMPQPNAVGSGASLSRIHSSPEASPSSCCKGEEDNSVPLPESVLLARSIWERMLHGLDTLEQTNLCRKMFWVLAKDLQEEEKTCEKIYPHRISDSDIHRSIVMLCGLEAYRRTIFNGPEGRLKHPENWGLLFDQILIANAYSGIDEPKGTEPEYFRFVLKLLVLIFGSGALVQALIMSPSNYVNSNEFWELMSSMLKEFDLGTDELLNFFQMGQLVMCCSSNPDYNREKEYILSYFLLQKIIAINNKIQ